jgi:peptide/nickel transport system ATP-binding protein
MPLLKVENLTTKYTTEKGTATAVDDVSFELGESESLGIVGESGCGKTTLAFSIMRLLHYNGKASGKVVFNGQSILDMPKNEFKKLQWKHISIVPQAAMGALNPIYTIGEQIVEAILAHETVSKNEAWEMAKAQLECVGLDRSRVKSYPHELSGGMCQRAVIAMALALEPELVIADEPTTALDAVTQVQILKLMRHLQRKMNLSLIYISHDLSILCQVCDKIMVMYGGKVVETGSAARLFTKPSHPYTQAMLSSYPDINGERKKLKGLSGSPPDILNFPSGCRFNPRCKHATDQCREVEPKMTEYAPNHFAACHLLTEKEVL